MVLVQPSPVQTPLAAATVESIKTGLDSPTPKLSSAANSKA